MRFIERTPEEVGEIIRNHREQFTVRAVGIAERSNQDPPQHRG
jgi:hypothetical protein